MTSEASKAADAYSRKEADRFASRVALTPAQYDLLKEMFALAWFEGYTIGVKATSEAVRVVLSTSIPEQKT